jgi:hypothetical protein
LAAAIKTVCFILVVLVSDLLALSIQNKNRLRYPVGKLLKFFYFLIRLFANHPKQGSWYDVTAAIGAIDCELLGK